MVRSESEQLFGMQIDIWKEWNLQMVNISFVGDIMCYPRMTKIANGDYSVYINMYNVKEYEIKEGTTENKINK